jgi:hypothetical protein
MPDLHYGLAPGMIQACSLKNTRLTGILYSGVGVLNAELNAI